MKKFLAIFILTVMTMGFIFPVNAAAAEYYKHTLVNADFDYVYAKLITDDGQVYFVGSNEGDFEKKIPQTIFTLDEKGEIDKSAQLSFYGNFRETRFFNVKQTGDNISVLYFKCKGMLYTDLVCEKFDRDLNGIGKYDLSEIGGGDTFADISVEKICFYKNRKIYLCDLDGSNKKTAVDLSDRTNYPMFTGLALSEKYISYTLKEGLYGSEKYYLGYYAIKSGKGKMYESDLVSDTRGFGNNNLYYSHIRNTAENFSFEDEPVIEGSGKFIAIIDGKIKTVKTYDSTEPARDGFITNDGKIITWMGSTGSKGKVDGVYIRIYENGKLTSEKIAKAPNFVSMQANGGKLAINYEVRKSGKNYVKTMLIDY